HDHAHRFGGIRLRTGRRRDERERQGRDDAQEHMRSPQLCCCCYHQGPRRTRQDEKQQSARNPTMAARKVTRQDLSDASEKYKNWGKWGPDDEIGTLNYTSAQDIVAAAQLVKKGKVISL